MTKQGMLPQHRGTFRIEGRPERNGWEPLHDRDSLCTLDIHFTTGIMLVHSFPNMVDQIRLATSAAEFARFFVGDNVIDPQPEGMRAVVRELNKFVLMYKREGAGALLG
jgi:hypothetical protein